MVTDIWVNIGSDNGLLPDGTKPWTKLMLTHLSSKAFCDMHLRTILQEVLRNSIRNKNIHANMVNIRAVDALMTWVAKSAVGLF